MSEVIEILSDSDDDVVIKQNNSCSSLPESYKRKRDNLDSSPQKRQKSLQRNTSTSISTSTSTSTSISPSPTEPKMQSYYFDALFLSRSTPKQSETSQPQAISSFLQKNLLLSSQPQPVKSQPQPKSPLSSKKSVANYKKPSPKKRIIDLSKKEEKLINTQGLPKMENLEKSEKKEFQQTWEIFRPSRGPRQQRPDKRLPQQEMVTTKQKAKEEKKNYPMEDLRLPESFKKMVKLDPVYSDADLEIGELIFVWHFLSTFSTLFTLDFSFTLSELNKHLGYKNTTYLPKTAHFLNHLHKKLLLFLVTELKSGKRNSFIDQPGTDVDSEIQFILNFYENENFQIWPEILRLFMKIHHTLELDHLIDLLGTTEYFSLDGKVKLELLVFLCNCCVNSFLFRNHMELLNNSIVALKKKKRVKHAEHISCLQNHQEKLALTHIQLKEQRANHFQSFLVNNRQAMVEAKIRELEHEVEKLESFIAKENEKWKLKEKKYNTKIATQDTLIHGHPIGSDRFHNKFWIFEHGDAANLLLMEQIPYLEVQKFSEYFFPQEKKNQILMDGSSLEDKQPTHLDYSNFLLNHPNHNIDSTKNSLQKNYSLESSSWFVCTNPQQLSELLSWLSPFGIRESALLQALSENKQKIESNPLFMAQKPSDKILDVGVEGGRENNENLCLDNFFYNWFIPNKTEDQKTQPTPENQLSENSDSVQKEKRELEKTWTDHIVEQAQCLYLEGYSRISSLQYCASAKDSFSKKLVQKRVSECSSVKDLVKECLHLEESLIKSTFDIKWKSMKGEWCRYADNTTTSAQFGILMGWLQRHLRGLKGGKKKK